MKKSFMRLLILTAALLIGVGQKANAQSEWATPQVPGSDVETLTSSDEIYVYNIEADAFVTSGMNWNTNCIATRLRNGDTAIQDGHRCWVTPNTSNKSLAIVHNASTGNHIGSNNGVNDVWVDFGSNYTFFYSETATGSKIYTLRHELGENSYLDVSYLYGGHLTTHDGKGFTQWAFITPANIANGSYAKYKAQKKMYQIYQACVEADITDAYATELAAAKAIYDDTTSSAADIKAATKTLFNAVASNILSVVDASFLFDNADMVGDGTVDANVWGTGFSVSYACFEKWHSTFSISQTNENLPNGFYTVKFHALWRQESGDTPQLTLTSGEDSQSANLPNMFSLDWGCNTNGGNDWTNWDGHIIPDRMKTAGQALTIDGAVATVSNFAVGNGTLTINATQTSNNQWYVFQGFEILYSSFAALKADILSEAANIDQTKPMNASVLSTLQNAITAVEDADTPDDITVAISALSNAIANVGTSIAQYESTATALTIYNAKAALLDEAGQQAYDVSDIQTKYDNRTLDEDLANSIKEIYIASVKAQTTEGTDFTDIVENASCASMDNWSINISFGNFHLNTWSTEGNTDGSNMRTPFIEMWNGANALPNSIISHTQITGLATGKYKVSIFARIYCEGAGASSNSGSLVMFANDKTLSVNTGTPITFNNLNGYYGVYEITATVTEAGTLDFGFIIDNAPYTWIAFKDAQLTFVRPLGEIDAAKDILEGAISSAEAIKDDVMTASVKADLVAKIAAAETAMESEDKDVVTAANSALTTAISAANTSIAAYAELASAIAPYAESTDTGVAAAYTAAKAIYDAATMTTEDVNAYIPTFRHNVYLATVETPYNGAAVTAGTFYLYNVEAGKFLQGYNDWGTRASLRYNGQAIKLETNGEGYNINTQISNGGNHWLDSGMWMDAGTAKYIFESIGDNIYIIRLDGTNYYLKYDGDSGYRINLNEGESNACYWQLVTADAIKAAAHANADRDNAFEVTSLIDDSNFSRGNGLKSSWSMGSECTNQNLGGGEQYNFCGESWRSAFTLKQTLNGMPNGIYTMTCQGFENPYDGNPQGAYIYANNATGSILTNTTGLNSMSGASEAFRDGQYENAPVTFVVTDGTITMGIKQERTTSWTIFDNFRLYYLGEADSVSMKISGTAHYGTFIAPFDVTLPEGIEAYGCSSTNGEKLELTSMNGTIPANTPAIVYSENAVNQKFYGLGTSENDEYTVGYLTGVYVEQQAPVDSYVLQDHDGVVKFYIVDDSYDQPTIRPNRCYLSLDGTEVKAFGFDFADAIKNINVNRNVNETIYNLAGQAVDKNYKGIVIKNGKKILVK